MKIWLDSETYSETDIKTGVINYTNDCYPILITYAFDNEPTQLWEEGEPLPVELKQEITNGHLVYAHNALFDHLALQRDLYVPLKQMRDTMAIASANHLPGSLEKMGELLGIKQKKQTTGKALIRWFCIPDKHGNRRMPIDHPEKWEEFKSYAIDDVNAMREATGLCAELSDYEQEVWLFTQRMNLKGVPFNIKNTKHFQQLASEIKGALNQELYDMTGVSSANAVSQLKAWLLTQGIEVESLAKDSITELMTQDLTPTVRRALEIRKQASMTSPAKFDVFLKTGYNGRIMGAYMYHGANCVDGETEVLTPQGWEAIQDWNGGEIMLFDKETEALSFDTCERHTSPEEVSSWVRYRSSMLDMELTEGHTVLQKSHRGNFSTVKAGDLFHDRKKTLVPTSGFYKGGLINDPAYLQMWAAVQADGHVNIYGRCRFSFKKARKISRMIWLLELNNLEYTMSVQKNGQTAFYVQTPPPKRFSKEILDYDQESLRAFISEISYWDSHVDIRNCDPDRGIHNGYTEYTNCNRSDIDWVQTISHLIGNKVNIRKRDRVEENWSISYRASLISTRGCDVSSAVEGKCETVFDAKRAYCPITSTGFWLARKNGKIFVTGNTGRYASRGGLNLQNVPRGSEKDAILAYDVIKDCTLDEYIMLFGLSIEPISSVIRPTIEAPPGKKFVDYDYSSIENRVAPWIGFEDKHLELFRKGMDEYKDFATEVYSVNYADVTKDMRQISKSAILGSIFGAGARGLQAYYAQFGVEISLETAQEYVHLYRQKHKGIVKAWYAFGRAIMDAAKHPGKVYRTNRCAIKVSGRFLRLQLPNKRILSWYAPKVEMVKAPWGDMIEAVTIMKKPKTGVNFVRQQLIGSSVFQSVVQATARDLLVFAMLELEQQGYDTVMTTHDEVVIEVDQAWDNEQEVIDIMTTNPEWCKEVPLAVEGWTGKNYRK
jgi:hypothetical protein